MSIGLHFSANGHPALEINKGIIIYWEALYKSSALGEYREQLTGAGVLQHKTFKNAAASTPVWKVLTHAKNR